MASSPVKLLIALLVFFAVGWVFFIFAARLLAWVLSRVMGASIRFQVAGCNCLRDVTVELRKGAVESLSIGEIKLSLRKSLVKLGYSFISGEPKLRLLISDLEIVIRSSSKTSIKKSKSQRPHSAGRGKWIVLTKLGRLLSVTVTELVIKIPKAAMEIKDMTVEISKNGSSKSILNVNLHLMSFLEQICDSQLNIDPLSSFCEDDCLFTGQLCSSTTEKNFSPFTCEDLLVSCEFGHDREHGIRVRDLVMKSGELTVNLNEHMFLKSKSKSETFVRADANEGATADKKPQKDNHPMTKFIFMFPDKVSFNMPKLNVKFTHRGQDLYIENNIMGIHLQSSKSQAHEDSGEITSHFGLQLDFSEIHILREGAISILEILKVAVIASVDVPMQAPLQIRTEIDLKLGGTRCNLIMSRLKPWLLLQLSKKKSMVLRDDNCHEERSQTVKKKAIMWSCTISAPEMSIMLYNLNDLPLYHGCFQSSHLFANNIASKGIQVHAELGELNLRMTDTNQDYSQNLFATEINSGSLMHVARLSLDWGHRETESHEGHDPNRLKLILVIDITGMGLYFGFKHVESLISTMVSFKALLKSLSASGKRIAPSKAGRSSKTTAKGTQILKLNLDKCSINYCGETCVEDMVVADPKRVNFGSQGGEVLIAVSADGTPRSASIISSMPSNCKHLKFCMSLDIVQLSFCLNKEKHSTKVELERASSIYQEYFEENRPGEKVALFDMQKAKFVRRSGGHNDIVCSLFNVADIAVRWEPDVHITLFELITRLRSVLYKMKNQEHDTEIEESLSMNDMVIEKEVTVDQAHSEKQNRKRESVFAIDVETLKVSAELADGVEAMIHIQSIFSENAKIGVLLEGLILSFNGARIFKSSRMQISRIPISVSSNLPDAKVQPATTWDWVVQGPDVHICMPYRLQLRAIDDAVEDTLRGLKLITKAKTNLIFPLTKDTSKKPKSQSARFGSVRFIIHKLTADIEEEPIQGWLDEHYRLMKNESCELAIRLKFFDQAFPTGTIIPGSAEPNNLSERKLHYNGIDIDAHDASSLQMLQEEIHKQAFRAYYQACQKMAIAEGSGACERGFQAGFRPSTVRDSLLSLHAAELDVTLTKIEGGDAGMIEFIKKTDPVCLDNEIPFSRMYGSDFVLNAGSLVVQLRDYTFPLFSATSGKCQGRIVLAQQATCFQPQMQQDVYIGRWWRVSMLRSASGTSPPMKMYSDMPILFKKGEVSFGVGYEPSFADISYAFTVALRRANLGNRSCTTSNNDQHAVDPVHHSDANLLGFQPPKKERSLPWWDDMRNYIHGKIGLCFTETKWNLLATTDPYEKLDKLEIVSGHMEIQHTDGRVWLSAKDFKAFLSSLENLMKYCSSKLPCSISGPFLESPGFSIEVLMDWECESGSPLNHYLHALPNEGEPRKKVYDPFRSTSLSLRWSFSLQSSSVLCEQHAICARIEENSAVEGSVCNCSQKLDNTSVYSPTVYLGAHDLVWLIKWWNMNYLPPVKLRSFSRWPRYGVPRVVRSGNLSLDRVMTEFFLRLDCAPICIQHMPLNDDDDPARGLTFEVAKLKFEFCFSRGKQHYTFDCKREPLDRVYHGLDIHLLKAYLSRNNAKSVEDIQTTKKSSDTVLSGTFGDKKCTYMTGSIDKHRDAGFLLHSDYFTIRKQTPKADPTRLLSWQEDGKKNLDMINVQPEFESGSGSDQGLSDPSDDDGFNVVIADNCQRVFVYGLKLLWTIENRDAVLFFVGGISKAFEPPKPSPSRQYAQRKAFERQQSLDSSEMLDNDSLKSSPSRFPDAISPSPEDVETLGSVSSHSPTKMDSSSCTLTLNHAQMDDSEEDGTRHFMVNVIQPQFNLHSEEANGRFLLAAASGRILARSFHSVLRVAYETIEQGLCADSVNFPETQPEMAWNRVELSVMLEHVQAHVAPTDVDPGAGLQWLPKILRSSPKVKRTGALLERVFMPCQMYFRYTRHKGGTPELKVKPLKELSFNSPNITAAMTSRQFQVMLDVLNNLLFARLPKPRKSSLLHPLDDDDYVEEEADEVVPDGVEEVELAKIDLEQRERERKLLLDDIRTMSVISDSSGDSCPSQENEDDLWMVTGEKSILVQELNKALANIRNLRKTASSTLRMALRKAAQLRLVEKEKNKSPSYAMRISMRINKVVWSMLKDGKSFVEAEINDMIYDFDRDYKDIGVAQFTTKSFILRNCLPNAKSDMLLSAWNPPSEWGKNVMLRVNAKHGAPNDGNPSLELFKVEIYPLKIHLTETMYGKMWNYFFPGEEQDSQRRQEVWKVSTTSGSRRVKKSASGSEATANSHTARESDAHGKLGTTTAASITAGVSSTGDSTIQVRKLQNPKANIECGSTPELRRSSSFDRTWEENVAESIANELVLQVHSSTISSSKSCPVNMMPEPQHATNEETLRNKPKDSKQIRSGRSSQEEKKAGKSHEEKSVRPRKLMDFHNIKISQVELLLTYEGSRFAVSDLRLLMDTFHRDEFTGTWTRLFSRIKKHIIWGVLKSVTGMQGKKFKAKSHGSGQSVEGVVGDVVPEDLNLSDSDGGHPAGKAEQFPISWPKKPSDGAGDGFVTSIRGLFSSQRRRAKAFVLRTMRGEGDDEFHGEWSENEAEFTPFARQLTITKAKKLIRQHTKKFRPTRTRKSAGGESSLQDERSPPRETSPFPSDDSGASSSYEEEVLNDNNQRTH